MYIGYKNPKLVYSMNNTRLSETTEEKDLGVLVDNELKFSQRIKTIAARATRMIGLIKVSFECLNKDMFLNLFKTLVRPLLEYCVQAWSPHYIRDITLLENVQRRATRMVREARGMSYEDRLDYLELSPFKI